MENGIQEAEQSQSNKDSEKGLAVITATQFSGPLPPPEVLEKYEQIQAGAADRIIRMAENQSKHRHDIENAVISSNIKNESVGIWLTFVLTIVLMIAGFYLIMNDKQVIGFFAVFGPVVFHSGNYIYNKRLERKKAKGQEEK